MVYTAGSIALAVLEWRAHLPQWPGPAVCLIDVSMDESLIWTPTRLPNGWKTTPAPPSVTAFGDAWISSQRSAVMRVPSAIVNQEWNYLLNPVHPDFLKLHIGRPRVFKLDPRLARLSLLEGVLLRNPLMLRNRVQKVCTKMLVVTLSASLPWR